MKKHFIIGLSMALCLVGCGKTGSNFKQPSIIVTTDTIELLQTGGEDIDIGVKLENVGNYLVEFLYSSDIKEVNADDEGNVTITIDSNVTQRVKELKLTITLSNDDGDIISKEINFTQPGLHYLLKEYSNYDASGEIQNKEVYEYDENNEIYRITYWEVPFFQTEFKESYRETFITDDETGDEITLVETKSGEVWRNSAKYVASTTDTQNIEIRYSYSNELQDYTPVQKTVYTYGENESVQCDNYYFNAQGEYLVNRFIETKDETGVTVIYYYVNGQQITPTLKQTRSYVGEDLIITNYNYSGEDFVFDYAEKCCIERDDAAEVKLITTSTYKQTTIDGEWVLYEEELVFANGFYNIQSEYYYCYINNEFSFGEATIFTHDERELATRIDYYNLSSKEDEGTLTEYDTFTYIVLE